MYLFYFGPASGTHTLHADDIAALSTLYPAADFFSSDDDFEEIFLPFEYAICSQIHSSIFVNSNGNLTLGAGDADFSESIAEFLGNQPRIALLWDDLSPNNGGVIIVEFDGNSITITFDGVPEFISTGANSFRATLYEDGRIDVDYGALSAVDGLARAALDNDFAVEANQPVGRLPFVSEETYMAAWQKGYAVAVEDALPLALQVMK